MSTFLDPNFLVQAGPNGLSKQIERLLKHLGFTDVSNIDGANDQGGDILARKDGLLWVLQSKWKLNPQGTLDESGVNEVLMARSYYGADRAAVVTNARFGIKASSRVRELEQAGITIYLWDANTLGQLWTGAPDRIGPVELHAFQARALDRVMADVQANGRALLVLATGLGKTYVAGEAINWILAENPGAQVLVTAHMKDLAQQLERALWTHLPKTIRTQLIDGDNHLDELPGVTCATMQTALSYVRGGYRPALVLVDEAHHVSEDGQYGELLELTSKAAQIGVTATPWRGDRFDITRTFGQPSDQVSIEDGMRLGFLAQVNYRLFADNIDWDVVRNLSEHAYTLRDLNARLFLPGRDEAIRDELIRVWENTQRPRGIVFCRGIEHAERMADLLAAVPQWRGARALHAGLTKRERQLRLMSFRSGDIPILTAVDILNEGVDVPDVNILCFARVTHSRRIFVQQLGRGLRLRGRKTHVEVLDFVSDIRRIAAVLSMRQSVGADEFETLRHAGGGSSITFTDQRAEALMREWIKDAASLETEADEVRLQFPDAGVVL